MISNSSRRLPWVFLTGIFLAALVLRSHRDNLLCFSPGWLEHPGEAEQNLLPAWEQQKNARLLHYYQNYRYILPAPRYDYNPYPTNDCGTAPDFGGFFQLSAKERSRLNEDKFIYNTFFKEHNGLLNGTSGTYVELGAYDGAQESNTRFFERCLGWKGLLIEGNPDSYEKVISNRRFAHRMSFAPSCSAEYEQVNRTIPFYRYPITNVGLVGHAKTYEGKPTVNVPCGPLSPVLEDVFGLGSSTEEAPQQEPAAIINFFSLDVEGAEALVLDTIDFQRVRIEVMMIEISNAHCRQDCEVRRQVRNKMYQEGYHRYERLVHASDIYVHPQSRFQIPPSVAKAPTNHSSLTL